MVVVRNPIGNLVMNTNYIEMASLYESEVAFGRSTASQMDTGSPVNKREIPCDSCMLADSCAAKFTECSAFRNWSKSGDFKDSDVARHIRVMKS